MSETESDHGGLTLHGTFARQAESYPDNVAVIDSRGEHRYGDISRMARALAIHLSRLGALKNTLVGVLCEKGADQVVSLLGVMSTGAAYLPLDPDWPLGRLEEILGRASVQLIVVTRAQRDRLEKIGLSASYGLVVVDDLRATEDGNVPLPVVSPNDLAYVIFTSGSTGKPKGVMISHEGALTTISAVNQRLEITSQDKVLAVSRITFDLSVFDIFGMLLAGGTIVFPSDERAADPAHWQRLIATYRVTIWDSVPQLMQLLVDHVSANAGDIRSLRCVLLSGDWIPVSLPGRVKELALQATVVSLGGATEGSIWSIWYMVDRVDPSWKSIPYGFAMPQQQIHVLDDQGKRCPVGVPGNIYIGGKGVALGYWDDPENTAKSFVKDGVLGTLFRTGDLGRWTETGYVEFLGRRDHQVKVNGYRIELEEISAKLALCPGVAQAVVLLKKSGDGASLAAYYVSSRPLLKSNIREFLAHRLPVYMLPRTYFEVAAIPLTANGKLDRDALLLLEDEEPATHVAPRSSLEQKVCSVWGRYLNAERIGITDDFFRVGGDSLLATRLAYALSEQLGLFVSPALILSHPNVADFVAALGGQADLAAIPRILAEDTPVSFQQEASLLEEVRSPRISAFPMAFEIADPAMIPIVKMSLADVVQRQDAFRTHYVKEAGGAWRQVVDEVEFVIEERWLSEEALDGIYRNVYHEPFDLGSGLPIKATIYHTERAAYLLVVVHTIVFDGWSIGVFVNDLTEAYLAYRDQETSPTSGQTEIRYVDYARWQRKHLSGRRLNDLMDFWRKKLAGYRPFSLDESREDSGSTSGAYVTFALDRVTSDELKCLAGQQETTLYAVMLAALYGLVYARTRQNDLAIVSLVANRLHREAQHVIGNFSNKVINRMFVDGRRSAAELIADVHTMLQESSPYAEAPFERIMAEVVPGESQRRFLPVMLNVHDFRAHLSQNRIQDDLRVVPVQKHFDVAKFALEFFVNPGREQVKGLVNYATCRHTPAFAESLTSDFVEILRRLPRQKSASLDELVSLPMIRESAGLGGCQS